MATLAEAAALITPQDSPRHRFATPTSAPRAEGKALPGLASDNAEHALRRGIEELAFRYAGSFSTETIDRYVHESYQSLYRTSRVKTHLPVLALRFAGERLAALAQATGRIAKPVPEVLFVCTQNSGRSQMAASLTQRLGGAKVHVRSAGSLPAGQVNPTVVEVMAKRGVDLDGEFPKPITDDFIRAADVVITMGCGDACPIYPGRRYLDYLPTRPTSPRHRGRHRRPHRGKFTSSSPSSESNPRRPAGDAFSGGEPSTGLLLPTASPRADAQTPWLSAAHLRDSSVVPHHGGFTCQAFSRPSPRHLFPAPRRLSSSGRRRHLSGRQGPP